MGGGGGERVWVKDAGGELGEGGRVIGGRRRGRWKEGVHVKNIIINLQMW